MSALTGPRHDVTKRPVAIANERTTGHRDLARGAEALDGGAFAEGARLPVAGQRRDIEITSGEAKTTRTATCPAALPSILQPRQRRAMAVGDAYHFS